MLNVKRAKICAIAIAALMTFAILGGCTQNAPDSSAAPSATPQISPTSSPSKAPEQTESSQPSDDSGIKAIQVQADSFDGKYRIETFGENKNITAAGLYPTEGTRIIEISSGNEVWNTQGFYETEFQWSPDSRYVAINGAARIYSTCTVVDTQDFEKPVDLPGIEVIKDQINISVNSERPDAYIKANKWVDDSTVYVEFEWNKEDSETGKGSYKYSMSSGEMTELLADGTQAGVNQSGGTEPSGSDSKVEPEHVATLYADFTVTADSAADINQFEYGYNGELTPEILAAGLTALTGLDFTISGYKYADNNIIVDWALNSTLVGGLDDREQNENFRFYDVDSLSWFMLNSYAMTLRENLNVQDVYFTMGGGGALKLPNLSPPMEFPADSPYMGSAFYIAHQDVRGEG